MLRITSFLLTTIIAIQSSSAQQSAVYFQQNTVTGILKSCAYENNSILFTNGKDVMIQDAEGIVRNHNHLNINDDALIKNIISVDGNAYLLYQIISSGKVQFGIIKLNNALEIEWYKTMSVSPGSLSAYSMAADEHSIYIANNNCTNGLTITKLNQSGEMVWNRTYHVGIGTIVPGYILLQNGQLTVYSKHTSSLSNALIVSTFNVNGNHIKSESYALSNSFYIRKVEQLENKSLVLINYNTGVVSSELVEITTSSYKGYVINVASALQLNDFVVSNDDIYFCGNIYVNAEEHLNAVLLGCKNSMQSLWAKQFSSTSNNNMGYDDAHCIVNLNQTICVNGINADKGFTFSYTEDQMKFCSEQSIYSASIQTNSYNKNNFNLSEESTPTFNLQNVICSSVPVQLSGNDFCTYETLAINTSAEDIKPSTSGTSLNIYPNPAQDNVTLEFNSLMSTCYWELIDINGRMLHGGMGAMKKLTFGVDELPAGVYIIRWESGDQRGTERLVIMH